MAHPPVTPGPQPGETAPRVIHYPADVQPIWDKHCLKCHGADSPEAGLDLTGTMTTLFSRSYENLVDRKLIKYISELNTKITNVEYLGPYSLGSHVSKLVKILREGHYEAQLSREEWVKLYTWIDANAQYYGSYYGKRNLEWRNDPDFRPAPTFDDAISRELPDFTARAK